MQLHVARARTAPWFGRLLAVVLFSFNFTAYSQAGAKAVPCAVDGSVRPQRATDVCRAVQKELGRALTHVDDARAVKRGDAVQFIQDDVHWVVIWLHDGRIRAWTRVSKTEAADDQVRFLARAARALSKAAEAEEPACLRLDPNAGRKMRSPDLTYPWAELARCSRRWVEVVDPWWVPGDNERAPT